MREGSRIRPGAVQPEATSQLARDAPRAAAAQVLPAGMALVASPLLQAAALRALQGFFAALISCKPAKTTYKALLTALLDVGRDPVRRPSPPAALRLPLRRNARPTQSPF